MRKSDYDRWSIRFKKRKEGKGKEECVYISPIFKCWQKSIKKRHTSLQIEVSADETFVLLYDAQMNKAERISSFILLYNLLL